VTTLEKRDHLITSLSDVRRRRDIPVWLKAEGLRVLAEVGVREGNHLLSLLKAEPTRIVVVDLWKDDGVLGHNDAKYSQEQFDRCCQRVRRIAKEHPCVKICHGLSTVVALQFADETFDFAYNDADHSYEGVRGDLEAWWPKIKPGGVLGGHDYILRRSPHGLEFGIVPALHEFIGRHDLRDGFHCTWPDEQPGNWFLRKRSNGGGG